MAGVWYCFAS